LRLRMKQPELAQVDLEAVYERTGPYPGLTGPLGRMFAAKADIAALEALIGEQLDGPDASIEVELVGAKLRLLQGRIDDARALLQRSLTKEPSNWEAHFLLADALLEAGEPAAALLEVDRVRAPQPLPELHLLKGQILEYNARHDEARAEYLAALALDPELHEARMWHGRLLALGGANKQAIVELRQVVEATGDTYPRAWLNLGRAQRGLGENAAALENLRKAGKLDPTLHEAFYLEGRLHADQNRHAQAIEAFQKALTDDATREWWYANALMDLGRAHAKAGQKKQALTTFETFLGVAPPEHAGRPEAKRQVEQLR
jgi:cellulose synthase operon protein C